MEEGAQIQEGLQEKHLRKQLAATAKSIQWSYAIFWATSAAEEGVLAWSDGYYNGDIKTRKTTQPMEFKADHMGLQRSEQLRELYESLSAEENNQQTRRPCASLSPEDLTATEWYYLVCMSFTFSPGQGLPGRALASNRHVWLSNAQFTNSRTFSRALLAKSASIQTVVCFPFMDGVLELGTTEVVLEDPNLIEQVTTTFWELSIPVCSEQSTSSSPVAEQDDEESIHPIHEHGLGDLMAFENDNLVPEHESSLGGVLSPLSFNFPSYTPDEEAQVISNRVEELNPNIYEELQNDSPDDSSNNFCLNNHAEDSFRVEGLQGNCQIQSHPMMEEEVTNCMHTALTSSDCISFANPPWIFSSPKGERIRSQPLDYLQEGNTGKLTFLDLSDETHYKRTLSTILINSKEPASMSSFLNCSHASSFRIWKRNLITPNFTSNTPQKLLKKILVDTSWMTLKPSDDNGVQNRLGKTEGDDAGANHVLSERRRREKLNEKFLVLRSLVPSISKVDKASILGDTIEYIKELERRVTELESCKEQTEHEGREKRKHPDVAERTSDNYGNNEDASGGKPPAKKRKACNIEEGGEPEHDQWFISMDGAVDINVTMIEKEIMLEIKCPWRDRLLLEIVDAMSSLHLDAYSVQSSTLNGFLMLTLKAKCKGLVGVSPGSVKRALQKIVKCQKK